MTEPDRSNRAGKVIVIVFVTLVVASLLLVLWNFRQSYVEQPRRSTPAGVPIGH